MSLVAGMTMTLSACALIIPEPAPTVYDLVIGEGVADTPGRTGGQLLIAAPKVLNSLNNDRIVIKPNPAEIAFYGRVRWSDQLPRLVQLYFARAFSKTGGARAVGVPGDGLVIDHQLLFDIRAFQVEAVNSGFETNIEIGVRILNDRNGRVVASNTFSGSETTQDEPVSAVAALNSTLDQVSIDLIKWVYSRI